MRQFFWSERRIHHTAETLPTLQKGSFIRISKNYISNVTVNYFISSLSKCTEKIRPGLSNYRWKVNTVRSEKGCSLFFLNFFLNFVYQNFFSNLLKKFFFEGFTLDASPLTESKRTLPVMKNIIYSSKRSKLNFRLVWCVRYFSSAHTAHITRDESSISSPHRIIYIIFFSESAIFKWSTQMFSRWHLIAKCIKCWLEVDTPIFLYNHNDASVKFVEFDN